MARSQTTSPSICEMREFASFSPAEQRFIIRSLDVFLGRDDAFKAWSGEIGGSAAICGQYLAYRQLRALKTTIPCTATFDGVADFIGALVRISAQDLVHDQLGSFCAYRFLYERMLGASARPFLPAAFVAAAALPQIRPEQRRVLLHQPCP